MSIEEERNYFFIFKGDHLLIKKDEDALIVPTESELKEEYMKKSYKFFIGELDLPCYAVEADELLPIPEDYVFQELYNCRSYYREKNFRMAGRAFQILNWNRNHQYCGACGTLLEPMKQDKSKTCPQCGKIIFPEISPAIIVAIFRENKILLAHNGNFPENLYSLIAGFVELGETLEEAVKREIEEEVGVQVKNIQYFESQPWPFPNSLMLGFTAEWAEGEIKVDGEEIIDANWYTPDNFPGLPGEGSIARRIIEWYVERYKNK